MAQYIREPIKDQPELLPDDQRTRTLGRQSVMPMEPEVKIMKKPKMDPDGDRQPKDK